MAMPAFGDWKGWVHVHTRFSDGELTPDQLALRAIQAKVKFVVPLDHFPGIDKAEKEINLRAIKVDSKYVGIENYLNTWEELNKKYESVVFIPGIEYTFSRSHLGIVGVTAELHSAIELFFYDSKLTDDDKIKKILELVRNSNALPLICHPTLKMAHPKNLGNITKEFQVTDYSFDNRLWNDEPIVLIEAMNHGNLDNLEDLAHVILNEGTPEQPSVVLVAGCDFHSDSAEFIGIHGNRMLDKPAQFPKSLERYTWVKHWDDKELPSQEKIMERLKNGNTYLTYGLFPIRDLMGGDRQDIRYIVGLEEIGDSEILAGDFTIDFGKKIFSNWTFNVYRNDMAKPVTSGSLRGEIQYFYVEKNMDLPHRYLFVVPGGCIAGPFYCRPPTAEEKLEDEKSKSFEQLIELIANLDQFIKDAEKLSEFRIEIIPTRETRIEKILESDPVLQFDRRLDRYIYIGVALFNVKKGEVFSLYTSGVPRPTNFRVALDIKEYGYYLIMTKIDLQHPAFAKQNKITITVRCRNIAKQITVNIESIAASKPQAGWKTVRLNSVILDLPSNFEGPSELPKGDYGFLGLDPKSEILIATVIWCEPINGVLTEKSLRDIIQSEIKNNIAGKINSIKVLNNQFGVTKILAEWTFKSSYMDTIIEGSIWWLAIQKQDDNKIIIIEIDCPGEYDLKKKKLIDQITASAKLQ